MKVEKIRGVILKNSWMPSGSERISIYSYSEEEKEYLVELNKNEKELKNNLEESVEVMGVLDTELEGTKKIERNKIWVKGFKILDSDSN